MRCHSASVQIEIENFKGIGSHQALELRLITPLFGPNKRRQEHDLASAALPTKILKRGNVNPDVTIAGRLIDLDSEPLDAIVSPPQQGHTQLTEFSFAHPLLRHTAYAKNPVVTSAKPFLDVSSSDACLLHIHLLPLP